MKRVNEKCFWQENIKVRALCGPFMTCTIQSTEKKYPIKSVLKIVFAQYMGIVSSLKNFSEFSTIYQQSSSSKFLICKRKTFCSTFHSLFLFWWTSLLYFFPCLGSFRAAVPFHVWLFKYFQQVLQMNAFFRKCFGICE